MAITLARSRSMLTVCIVLVVAVGLAVAVGVIPPVRLATNPDISPESAVPAFWAGVGFQAFAALVLILTTVLSKGRSWISTACLVATGILVLFLGFVLGDAARAFLEVGMSTVGAILLACVAADVLAGALVITTAILRPRITQEGNVSVRPA